MINDENKAAEEVLKEDTELSDKKVSGKSRQFEKGSPAY